MKKYFCTLFDSNYLIKGLTMIKSLSEFCEDFDIFVLCMDNQTKFLLEKIQDIILAFYMAKSMKKKMTAIVYFYK